MTGRECGGYSGPEHEAEKTHYQTKNTFQNQTPSCGRVQMAIDIKEMR